MRDRNSCRLCLWHLHPLYLLPGSGRVACNYVRAQYGLPSSMTKYLFNLVLGEKGAGTVSGHAHLSVLWHDIMPSNPRAL